MRDSGPSSPQLSTIGVTYTNATADLESAMRRRLWHASLKERLGGTGRDCGGSSLAMQTRAIARVARGPSCGLISR